jgi:hypothetical protein
MREGGNSLCEKSHKRKIGKMKNLNALLPKPQELNEGIRNPGQIAGIPRGTLMLEPKFDGSFIYVTRDRTNGKTILCTKDGNQLSLEPRVQRRADLSLPEAGRQPVRG